MCGEKTGYFCLLCCVVSLVASLVVALKEPVDSCPGVGLKLLQALVLTLLWAQRTSRMAATGVRAERHWGGGDQDVRVLDQPD